MLVINPASFRKANVEHEGVGEVGGRERMPTSGQSFCALGRRMLSTWPQVGIWLCEATDPTQQWGDKGQPLPHTRGPRATPSVLEIQERGQRERGSHAGESP